MKLVIQRVASASVTVDQQVVGQIESGLLILLGIAKEDTPEDIKKIAKKVVNMRIFSDTNDKFNHSLLDIQGHALVVSQFTLIADLKKGNRPSFVGAADPEYARTLYTGFTEELRVLGISRVETGRFGASMKVSLINDGPVTIVA